MGLNKRRYKTERLEIIAPVGSRASIYELLEFEVSQRAAS